MRKVTAVKRIGLLATSMGIVAASGGFAHAQDQGSVSGEIAQSVADQASGDIVVTARRRGESLQSVPDTIQAFTADAIETRGLTKIDSIASSTSNLFIVQDQDPSTTVITVRGITTNRNQAGSVAFVIDDVTVPDSDGFQRELFDIERIEVLKGPQGALYGKGAIGGVVNVITRKPGNAMEGNATFSYGSGNLKSVRASVGGPLVLDRLFFQVSGSYRDYDGQIRNTTLNQHVDYLRNKDIRGRMLWTPSADWTVDLRAAYSNEKGGAAYFSSADLMNTAPGGRVGKDLLANPRGDYLGYQTRELTDFSMKVERDTSLGRITSITAYNEIDKFFVGDLDNSPLPLIQPASQKLDVKAWSQELRLVSPSNRDFSYVLGAFYQHTDRRYSQAIDSFDLGYFGLIPGLPVGVPSGIFAAFPPITTDGTFKQWAVFGQGGLKLGSATELTFALRYDRDTRRQFSGRSDKTSFDAFQPKVSLSHKIDEAKMVYATYSEGFKSGSFNPPPEAFPLREVDFDLVVRPERTKNFELGWKTTWLNKRIRFNVAGFLTRYENLQIFQFDPFAQQVTVNTRRTRIKGYEAELVVRPVDGLTLDASYGYTHSRVRDFNGTPRYIGNTPPNTPDYTLNLGAEFSQTVALPGNPELRARADWRRVGKFYWQLDNNLYTPAHDSTDLRIGLGWNGVEIAVWARNLFNQRWAVGGIERTLSPLILGTLNADNFTVNKPRQLGADLKVKF